MQTTRKEFTQKDGLRTQTQQLQQWGKILKDKVYAALIREANKQNNLLKPNDDGYKVWRGTDMEMYIHNTLMKTTI